MKIDRVTSDNSVIYHTVNADKILKDEKQVFAADAVILDSDRQKQPQQQSQEEEKKEAKDGPGKNPEDAQPTLPLGKKIDILV